MTKRRAASAEPKKNPVTGKWEARVRVGKGADGKWKWAHPRGDTKREVQAKLDDVRGAVRTQSYVPPKRQTFADYIDHDWLPVVKLNQKPSTYESYARNLRVHILPRIGQLQLGDIGPTTLDRLYAELRQSGHRGHRPGAGLSVRSVRYIHSIVRRSLGDAVKKGRLVRNAADAADPPDAESVKRSAKKSMHTWSAAQLEEFLRRSEGNRYQPAWMFLATTGCRRGEAVGMTWDALNLNTGQCKIRQTITAINHQVHIEDGTKTDDGRVIQLDARTVAVLRTLQKVHQAQERLLLGAGYQDHGLAFCHPDGRPYHPERFSREFDRMVARLGMPRIRLHDLRHTWASLALEAKVPLKVVSERLGHATTSVTADIYSHVTPPMDSEAAETVATLIFGL